MNVLEIQTKLDEIAVVMANQIYDTGCNMTDMLKMAQSYSTMLEGSIILHYHKYCEDQYAKYNPVLPQA